MEDYPSADWPLVVREELLFNVKINPCLVSSLEVGSYFEKVEYIVGNPQKTVTFSFTQNGCDYAGTYTMTDDDGNAAPSFLNQVDRYAIFDVYTVDESHVGNYTDLTVTVVLDNIALFADLDPLMDDYISDINDPVNSYAGSGALHYTAEFKFWLEVFPPESSYEEADNSAPYLFPVPEDFSLTVGEPIEFWVGDAYDAESANQTMSIAV